MNKIDTNTPSSRRREILKQTNWRKRVAPPQAQSIVEFNPHAFPSAPWHTLIYCDNKERLHCPPGPWSCGNDTISRQDFCTYLFNNGYDDVHEVIDIAERQFAARWRAPVELREKKLWGLSPHGAGTYDAPQEMSIEQHPVSLDSRLSASVKNVDSTSSTTSSRKSLHRRISSKISPGTAGSLKTTSIAGRDLPFRPAKLDVQPCRPFELPKTFEKASLKALTHTAVSVADSNSDSMFHFGSDFSPSSCLQNSTSKIPIPVEVQYTIDDFKNFIGRQMGVDFLGVTTKEEEDDHPGM